MPQGFSPFPVTLDCAAILERLPVALALVDADNGHFITANEAFRGRLSDTGLSPAFTAGFPAR